MNIKPCQDRPATASAEFRSFLKDQADAIIEGRGMPAKWRAKRDAKAAKKASKKRRRKLPVGAPVNRPIDQGVYVIGAPGHPIKIGIAKNVARSTIFIASLLCQA